MEMDELSNRERRRKAGHRPAAIRWLCPKVQETGTGTSRSWDTPFNYGCISTYLELELHFQVLLSSKNEITPQCATYACIVVYSLNAPWQVHLWTIQYMTYSKYAHVLYMYNTHYMSIKRSGFQYAIKINSRSKPSPSDTLQPVPARCELEI